MSFSASDIFSAVQVGIYIYNHWIDESNQADARYREFLKDVRHLSSQLKRLGQIYQKAEAELQRDNLVPQLAGHAVQNSGKQGMDLVGDFSKTLEECRRLLVKNEKYAEGGFDVIRAAKWHSFGLESESQALRERIKFHCTKILLIVAPLEVELLQSISNNIHGMQQQLRELNLRVSGAAPEEYNLPPVPAELSVHYEDAALNQRPFDSAVDFPFKETVNALLFHFSHSTINASVFQNPGPEQFNALLKARWLLDKVRNHAEYKRMPLSLTRNVVSSVEEKLKFEYYRFEDGWASEQSNSIFSLENWPIIWFDDNQTAISSAITDEIDGESKIMDLPLAFGSERCEQGIVVFRQRRKESEFRILKTTVEGVSTELKINTLDGSGIPHYALPGEFTPKNVMSIYTNSFSRPDQFEMEQRLDVLTLQQAFTNYRVIYDGSAVQWTLSRDSMFHKTPRGTVPWSGIQLWQPEILPRIGDANSEIAFNEPSSRKPLTFNDDLVSILPGQSGSFSPVVQPQRSGDSAVAGAPPKNPALIIFTRLPAKHGDAYAYVYIPLESGISINPKRCGCVNPTSNCLDVVLEMNPRKRDKFKVKIHRALDSRHEEDEREWNLFLFRDPKPDAYRQLETIEDARELHLRFARINDRKEFLAALLRTIHFRDDALKSFNQMGQAMKTIANRPPTMSSVHAHASRVNSVSRQSFAGVSPPPSQHRSHRASASSITLLNSPSYPRFHRGSTASSASAPAQQQRPAVDPMQPSMSPYRPLSTGAAVFPPSPSQAPLQHAGGRSPDLAMAYRAIGEGDELAIYGSSPTDSRSSIHELAGDSPSISRSASSRGTSLSPPPLSPKPAQWKQPPLISPYGGYVR